MARHLSPPRPTGLPPVWVTVHEAGRLTGLGRTSVYELIATGELKSAKIAGRRLVSYASIRALGSEPSEAA